MFPHYFQWSLGRLTVGCALMMGQPREKKATRLLRLEKTSLVALAYATARDLDIAPSAVLIRFVMPMVPDCDLQITPPCYHGQRRPRAND